MKNLANVIQEISSEGSLNPKIKSKKQQNIHNWYPYYAGYDSIFVETILSRVREQCGSVRVLDPWNGSGTTTLIAYQQGHTSFGFDINPVLSLVSSAKLAHVDDVLNHIELAKSLIESTSHIEVENDPLSMWLDSTVIARYRSIERILMSHLATNIEEKSINPTKESLPPATAFLLLALIKTARGYAAMKQSSNPTWVRPGSGAKPLDANFEAKWIEQAITMAKDLKVISAKPSWVGLLDVADARNLPLDDKSIDLVLTSPPYCTRIDYVINASFELAALGITTDGKEFAQLRRNSMGTPLSRDQNLPCIPLNWPDEVKLILTSIREHSSRASRTYYYKTYWQYFEDVINSLTEIHRVVRPGGAAVLVVQNSYYKNIHIDLPSLYVACAEKIGFSACISSQVDVRRAMTQIHSNSKKHQAEKSYCEGIVVMERVN